MIYYDLMAFQLIFHSTQAIRRVSEVASFPHKLLLAIKYLFSSVEPTLAMFFVRCIQATHRKRHPQDGPNPRAKASGERWSGDMSAERDWDTVASVALAPAGAAGFAACALPLSLGVLSTLSALFRHLSPRLCLGQLLRLATGSSAADVVAAGRFLARLKPSPLWARLEPADLERCVQCAASRR